MPSIACTLFENHHHIGVAALINSLSKNNYKGTMYAGYRGALPAWCNKSKPATDVKWRGASVLNISTGFNVVFLPLVTDYYLIYYKPTFVLELFEVIGDNANAIAYFDCDIVVKSKWIAFERWMSYGVALVQETNNFPDTHPMRGEWKAVIDLVNRKVTRTTNSYFNAGFIGVSRVNIEFLVLWAAIIQVSIDHFNLNPKRAKQTNDRTYLFYNLDQDALNIAAMCSISPLSELGPEGMDFAHGGFAMSHAIGRPKPWQKNFLLFAFKAVGPRLADRAYWANAAGPVQLFSNNQIKMKNFQISLAAFICRFYKRS